MKIRSEITELLRGGNKIGAIKHAKDTLGCDLQRAKQLVEGIEEDLAATLANSTEGARTDSRILNAEKIFTEADLIAAVSPLAQRWQASVFSNISMGWKAELVCDHVAATVTIWSHRGDIEAGTRIGDEARRRDDLLHPRPKTISDFEQVRHILTKVAELHG